ncbi:histidine phosphatase family protein [bacterium]|nr:histidine phosphatase family protein [bacterium]
MYFNRKCKVTFIAHGATIYTEEARFSDSLNYPPLSELGVEEITNLINYLKARGVKNDAIYASSSVRTAQSAMMISKVFKQDYNVVEELTTRECGSWNGLTLEQVQEKYPNGLKYVIENPEKETLAGAESSVAFIERIGKVIDQIVNENIGNRIIIVTHPEVIQAAICSALKINADKLPKFYIRTGSATQISYYEDFASLVYSDYVPV